MEIADVDNDETMMMMMMMIQFVLEQLELIKNNNQRIINRNLKLLGLSLVKNTTICFLCIQ
jgi:hypothetical protein